MERKTYLLQFLNFMKTVSVFVLIMPVNLKAQNISSSGFTGDYQVPVAYAPEQVKAVGGHLLCFGLLGISYGYECPIASRGTFIVTGGVGYYYTPSLHFDADPVHGITGSLQSDHLLVGQLGIEPRFYYNLRKRYREGKRTFGNSGGYLSAELEYAFPIASTHDLTRNMHFFDIVPYWGIRRVWRHFLLDVSAGFGYIHFINGSSGEYASIRLGLGIRF